MNRKSLFTAAHLITKAIKGACSYAATFGLVLRYLNGPKGGMAIRVDGGLIRIGRNTPTFRRNSVGVLLSLPCGRLIDIWDPVAEKAKRERAAAKAKARRAVEVERQIAVEMSQPRPAGRRTMVRAGSVRKGDTIGGRRVTGLGRVWTARCEDACTGGPQGGGRVQYAYFA